MNRIEEEGNVLGYFKKNVELDKLRTKLNGLHRANDTLMSKNIDLEFELSELKMKYTKLDRRYKKVVSEQINDSLERGGY